MDSLRTPAICFLVRFANMYIPPHYQGSSHADAIKFVRNYGFGILVSNGKGGISTTHLPFIVRQLEDRFVLSSHMAKANDQHEGLDGKEVWVIFSGPHAYISPRHYEKENNVPTWNYVAVHVKGRFRILNDKNVDGLMEEMISNYEPDYHQHYSNLSLHYKKRMMAGIVGFDIQIMDIQYKQKLSQNKTDLERERIINYLVQSQECTERTLGQLMAETLTAP